MEENVINLFNKFILLNLVKSEKTYKILKLE
jgi:hypothetical protein